MILKILRNQRTQDLLPYFFQRICQHQSLRTPSPKLSPVTVQQVNIRLQSGTRSSVQTQQTGKQGPLVRRYQDGMTAKFSGRLEQLNLAVEEKRAVTKAHEQHVLEDFTQLYEVQKQMAAKRKKLEDSHCALAEATTKYLQVEDQQGETKSRYSLKSSWHTQVSSEVSGLQATLDKVLQQILFTQGVGEDLSSKVKTMTNVRRKQGSEKTQAEQQKLKQDLYIERLTTDVERLTQQIATYEAQARAQAEEKCAVKQALYESEVVIETLFLAHKQLLQQWNSSLKAISGQDEALSAMQEARRSVRHQVILLDREIEGHKKSLTSLQQENEAHTDQLHGLGMECDSRTKRVSQKQADQEALEASYSHCSRILQRHRADAGQEHQGGSRTQRRLMIQIFYTRKRIEAHQAELKHQRKWLEKESGLRLQLEDKIMTHMQQKLSHSKAAQDCQHLMSKTASLKNAKICRLEQLVNELMSATLESQQVEEQVSILALTQEALEEKLAKCNKSLTTSESQMSSMTQLIKQKCQTISTYNQRLAHIQAKTGHEDLSPLEVKAEETMAQVEATEANIMSKLHLWLKQQEVLVTQSQEMEHKNREISKLQTEYIAMQQSKIRFESQNELEEREEAELDKTLTMLNRDVLKLSSLVSEKKQLSLALEQDHALMETKYLQKIKDDEWESINMQMNLEKVEEEKERLLNALVESEQQLMLWEKKAQILEETFSIVDMGQDEIRQMKNEIHRMEVRIEQLKKQQESLGRESDAVVETWEHITQRKDAMARTSPKKNIKGEMKRFNEGLQHKIDKTCDHVAECVQACGELGRSQDSLRDGIEQEKQSLIQLSSTKDNMDSDLMDLQGTKEIVFAYLVTLQSRSKRLRAVHQGSYEASSSSERVQAALQSQTERLQRNSSILQRLCEEVPEHRDALSKVLQALAARTQML
ncbi:LOW QUALITY PROTEIN: coiled-coil domain-containing protein 40 [Cololabis saira]|uniref:LOW QUALITY PROTEIN: coiled-coil domain-containing protein 40 n=1 Tax=Cololabis saira TaxID=129043 RepID=UPI002AD2DF6A|nr:LOW QUALITY PROTEIN: coiled-coil domain-containing protein 40 [Cololabis saira]